MARIPNSSDASSMWKMNDIYVAENGGEWVPAHVPAALSQYYIKRFVGWNVSIIDGVSTNPLSDAICRSTWGNTAGGNACDAISFAMWDNGGYSPHTDYLLNKISVWCGDNHWMNGSNNTNQVSMIIRVYQSTYTGYSKVYDSGTVTRHWRSAYDGAVNYRALCMIDMPANTIAPYEAEGVMLDVNTTYTVGFSVQSSSTGWSGAAWTDGSGVGDVGSLNNAITLSSGAGINMQNWNVVGFHGVNGFGSSQGTTGWTGSVSSTMGHLPVLGAKFWV